jgi:putative DNA primase/helicase
MRRRAGSAVHRILGMLEKVRRTKAGWMARCPAHDDHSNSLSVGVGRDRRVLLKCFAGCTTDAIVRALAISMRDLFEPRDNREDSDVATATAQPSPKVGLTLAQYAEAKALPTDFLLGLGLSDCTHTVPRCRRM